MDSPAKTMQEKEGDLHRYLKRRSRRRLARVVQAYYQHVWKVAFGLTRNSEDAADVCQDVFLKLLLEPPPAKDVGSARGYLAWCAVTRVSRMRRASERRKNREREAAVRAAEIDFREDLEDLREAIAGLPEDLRVPVDLRYLAGLDDTEIADVLGIADRTVRDRLQRAREWLKERLAPGAAAIVFTGRVPLPSPPPPGDLLPGLLKIVCCGSSLSPLVAATWMGVAIMWKKIVFAAVVLALLLFVGIRLATRPEAVPDPVLAAPARIGELVAKAPEAKPAPSDVVETRGDESKRPAPEGEVAATAPAGEGTAETEEWAAVEGIVVDQLGSPCPGAEVKVLDDLTGDLLQFDADDPAGRKAAEADSDPPVMYSVKTDGKGAFRMGSLPIGQDLLFEVSGERSDGAKLVPTREPALFEEGGVHEVRLEVSLAVVIRCRMTYPADMGQVGGDYWLLPVEDEPVWNMIGFLLWMDKKAPEHHRRSRIKAKEDVFIVDKLESSEKPWLLRVFLTNVERSRWVWGEVRIPALEPGIRDVTVDAVNGIWIPQKKRVTYPEIGVLLVDEGGQPLDAEAACLSSSSVFVESQVSIGFEAVSGLPAEFRGKVRSDHVGPRAVTIRLGRLIYRDSIDTIREGETYTIRCPMARLTEATGTIVVNLKDVSGAPADGMASIEPAGSWENYRPTKGSSVTFRFLPPGDYRVRGHSGSMEDPRIAPWQTVTLSAKEVKVIDLTITKVGRLAVRLSPRDASITVMCLSGSTMAGQRIDEAAAFDERARFYFHSIPPGTYWLVACGTAGVFGPRLVTIDETAEAFEADLDVSAPTRQVEFRNESGKTLLYIQVWDGEGRLIWRRKRTNAEVARRKAKPEDSFQAHLPDGVHLVRYCLLAQLTAWGPEGPGTIGETRVTVAGGPQVVPIR